MRDKQLERKILRKSSGRISYSIFRGLVFSGRIIFLVFFFILGLLFFTISVQISISFYESILLFLNGLLCVYYGAVFTVIKSTDFKPTTVKGTIAVIIGILIFFFLYYSPNHPSFYTFLELFILLYIPAVIFTFTITLVPWLGQSIRWTEEKISEYAFPFFPLIVLSIVFAFLSILDKFDTRIETIVLKANFILVVIAIIAINSGAFGSSIIFEALNKRQEPMFYIETLNKSDQKEKYQKSMKNKKPDNTYSYKRARGSFITFEFSAIIFLFLQILLIIIGDPSDIVVHFFLSLLLLLFLLLFALNLFFTTMYIERMMKDPII